MPGKKKAAKRPAKKAPASKAKKAPAKKKAAPAVKVPRKKVAKTAAKKASPRKKTGPGTRSLPADWQVNEHGFRVGSDLAHIVDAMVAGGKDRREVIANARESIGSLTSGGIEKNISSAITTLLPKLEEKGYRVESHWQLVPPARPRKVKKS